VFFQQFSVLRIKGIPLSVDIDSLALFFVTFDYQGKTSSAPLVFRRTTKGEVWFLPEGSRSLDYLLASDWFDSLSRDTDKADSYECKPAEIARATHRVPISTDPALALEDRSYLYLTGWSAGEASATELSKRIESTLRTLKASLKAYDGASLLQSLEPVGAKRLKDWWATAGATERANYISTVVSQEPFFVLDLNPLLVLYSKSKDNVPRVMYLVRDQEGTLRWTNSYYGTTLDLIFKNGPLYDAAKSSPPFDAFSIRR